MPSSPPLQRDHLQDRVLEIDTPELVSIEIPLAGLGSRYAALLIDTLILMGLAVLVFLLLLALGFAVASIDGALVLKIVIPLGVIAAFALYWGYFFYFEAFRDGQTPGKKRMRIRVVLDGGYPITVEASAIRNLLRVVDTQFGGLVGGLFMLLSPCARRLGDMAASTVVVREMPVEFPEIATATAVAEPPKLPDTAFGALELFADRHASLPAAQRQELADAMAARLATVETPRTGETREAYLLRFHAEEQLRRAAHARGGSPGRSVESAAALGLLRTKREKWLAFRDLTATLRRSKLRSLGEDGVGEFAARYREISADLARARTYGASTGTIYSLERLVGIGHNLFYRPATRTVAGLWRWLVAGFPSLVRQRRRPIAVAAALLFGPAIVAWGLVALRPDLERRLVPAGMILRAEEAASRRATSQWDKYIDVPLSHEFLASAIIANNVQVSFLAFATGVTGGLLTAALLVFNGLSFGFVLAVFSQRGVLDVIGIFVLPHGVIELTAISIAGGAGLWMGSALLLPGRRSRRDAFAIRAREAISLIGGVVVMLLVAGLIEGFISPAEIPPGLKLLVAAVAAAALAAYLVLGGREGSSTKVRGA